MNGSNKLILLVLIFSISACQTNGMGVSGKIVPPNMECENLTKEDPWGNTVEALCGLLGPFCDTVKVKVQVSHPAEIDLTKYNSVAFANIGGNAGDAFASELKEHLVRNGKLKVVDRKQWDTMMKELELENSDLVNPTNRAKIGKLLPATALVMGNVNHDYKESTSNQNSTCKVVQKKKTVSVPCTKTIRTGVGTIDGEISIEEVETGTQIQVKRLHSSTKEKTETTASEPAPINQAKLQETNLSIATSDMVKAMLPWTETRKIVFYKKSDLPTLKRGIKEAQAGELEGAKKIFSKTIEDNKGNSNISQKDLAAAYFDLGVAYAYTDEFDKADEAFKTVDDLAFDEYPAATMRKIVKCLREDRDKLDQHIASK